jgi:hypothetical protein
MGHHDAFDHDLGIGGNIQFVGFGSHQLQGFLPESAGVIHFGRSGRQIGPGGEIDDRISPYDITEGRRVIAGFIFLIKDGRPMLNPNDQTRHPVIADDHHAVVTPVYPAGIGVFDNVGLDRSVPAPIGLVDHRPGESEKIDILAHHDVLFTLGVAGFHEDRFQRVIESPEELIPESRPSAILGSQKSWPIFPGLFLGRSHERTEKSGFPFITLHVIKNVSGLPIFHPVIRLAV